MWPNKVRVRVAILALRGLKVYKIMNGTTMVMILRREEINQVKIGLKIQGRRTWYGRYGLHRTRYFSLNAFMTSQEEYPLSFKNILENFYIEEKVYFSER